MPVGAYLSGGLDSSLITALAQAEDRAPAAHVLGRLRGPALRRARLTSRRSAEAIGTGHHVVDVGPDEIAAAFPDVVWHAETPLIRTAPVPLYLLAREVRASGITVVATGEGADELFWGYDLFKEVVARELNRSRPRARRGALVDRLYPAFGAQARAARPGVAALPPRGRRADDALLGSHLTRAAATGAVKALYGRDCHRGAGRPDASLERLRAEACRRLSRAGARSSAPPGSS